MAKIGKNRFFTFLIFVLIAIVGVQAYFLYTMNEKMDEMAAEKHQVLKSINWEPLKKTIEKQKNVSKEWLQSFQKFIESMQEELSSKDFDLFGNNEETPLYDDFEIEESDTAYFISFSPPFALDPSNLKASIANNTLTLQGTSKEITEEKDKKGNITQRHETQQSFLRTLPLPSPIIASSLKTKFKEDQLIISLQKQN